jgi:peptidoglycan/LPS O-acetylase OafA/YrhL
LSDRGVEPGEAQLLHLPALDGLRGLAVAAVLFFHAQYGFMKGGFLGVSAFFTLSGFLITTLLLVERDSAGRIDLPGFWGRRARRLLPAAFLALGGIVLYGAFVASAVQRAELRGDVLSALFYFANWHFIYAHQSYAEIFNGTPSPVLHFWSLAIEEQFYLFFPGLAALLLWIGRGRTRVLGMALAVLTLGSVVIGSLLISSTGNTTRVYYGTDTRAAELLIGALLAVLLVGRRRPATGSTRVVLGVAGSLAFVAMLVMWSTTSQTTSWLYHGGFALHAVLVSAVLAEVLLAGPLSKLLSVKPLQALGVISYGVYLYHWPIFLWLGPDRFPQLSRSELFLLRVGVTIAIATASFYFIERPVRTGVHIRVWWPRVLAPATAFALLVATFLVVRPEPVPASARIVFAPISKSPPPVVGGATANAHGAPVSNFSPFPVSAPAKKTSTTAAPQTLLHRPYDGKRPLRVLIVGDSVGQTFGRGVELWGMQTGAAQVWNDAHFYCSLARFAPRIVGIGRTGPQAPICDDWDQRWTSEVAQFDPDVTIVLYTIWEMVARKPPGAHDWENPGNPQYDSWQLSEYEHAADVLSARGGTVDWLEVPCLRTSPPGSQGDQQIHYENSHQIDGVAKARPKSVRVIDFYDQLCPGGKFSQSYGPVTDARPDGAHFSDPGAEAVANWLMNKILAN